MRSNYKTIGELVERVDIRNTDGRIDTLIGLSIEKCFIRSVANTIGTDLTKYKKIRKNQFAVSLMQVSRDEKIPVACLKEFDEAIICYWCTSVQCASSSDLRKTIWFYKFRLGNRKNLAN